MDARLELVLAAAIILFAVLMSVRAVRGARDEDVADISGPYDEKIRLISEVPRPRPIRMTFKAKGPSIHSLSGSPRVVRTNRKE